MRLGALASPPQAQLDGFKSRVLRAEAPAQRHLYATEWWALELREAVTTAAVLVLGDECLAWETSRAPHQWGARSWQARLILRWVQWCCRQWRREAHHVPTCHSAQSRRRLRLYRCKQRRIPHPQHGWSQRGRTAERDCPSMRAHGAWHAQRGWRHHPYSCASMLHRRQRLRVGLHSPSLRWCLTALDAVRHGSCPHRHPPAASCDSTFTRAA